MADSSKKKRSPYTKDRGVLGAFEVASNQKPYTGPDNIGNFAVFVFNASSQAPVVNATFDNATAGFTIQPPLPPIIKHVLPTASSSGNPAFLTLVV